MKTKDCMNRSMQTFFLAKTKAFRCSTKLSDLGRCFLIQQTNTLLIHLVEDQGTLIIFQISTACAINFPGDRLSIGSGKSFGH